MRAYLTEPAAVRRTALGMCMCVRQSCGMATAALLRMLDSRPSLTPGGGGVCPSARIIFGGMIYGLVQYAYPHVVLCVSDQAWKGSTSAGCRAHALCRCTPPAPYRRRRRRIRGSEHIWSARAQRAASSARHADYRHQHCLRSQNRGQIRRRLSQREMRPCAETNHNYCFCNNSAGS